MNQMSEMLAPLQLGYGVRQGAEAAVHTTRIYLENLPPNNILLKLDFRNAFNSIRRDKLLEAARVWVPEIFPFVHSSYLAPSNLYYSDTTLQSSEGVQQGDPLGPLLFCLTIHPLLLQLKSELRVFYLDDGTIGGAEDDVLADFMTIKDEAALLGLELNASKSELICLDPDGGSCKLLLTCGRLTRGMLCFLAPPSAVLPPSIQLSHASLMPSKLWVPGYAISVDMTLSSSFEIPSLFPRSYMSSEQHHVPHHLCWKRMTRSCVLS